MSNFNYILFFLFFSSTCLGQNLYLDVNGSNDAQTRIIDSVGYSKKHSEGKKVQNEVDQLQKKLILNGYFENKIIEQKKSKDSIFNYKIDTGNKTKFIHIYIGKKKDFDFIKEDTLKMAISETENSFTSIAKKLETLGYPLAKVKLNNIRKEKNYLIADLNIENSSKRNLSNIIYNGFDKFPENHKKNILKKFKNSTITTENLEKIYSSIQKIRFVKQTKYPELLFTKDSTIVYVYIDKNKSNSFDGFLGFSNNETKKIVFSGYIDLTLNNILNSGEKIALNWRSDGKQQKNFDVSSELPYIFKTPFAIKAQLNIFKQDSTFQNTKTSIDLGYFSKYNSRFYIGYVSTESSDIRNLNNLNINDFDNSFLTIGYEYIDFNNENFLFPEKTNIQFKTGFGKRNAKSLENNQLFISINLSHNFYFNENNLLNIKSQNYFLDSQNYFVNELYRFGGIKSIRGFTENSLQANLLTSLLTEYRYQITNSLYTHSIIDYAYFKDNSSSVTENLYGLGFGIGILSKNGLFNLIYANGSSNSQQIKLSNSIIHVSFKANF